MINSIHKYRTAHSFQVILKIIELSKSGVRSADISKNSIQEFGYKIRQSSISNILSRNGVNAKLNSYRRGHRKNRTRKEELVKETIETTTGSP